MTKIDKGRIGSFLNYKILEWSPLSFTIEFIYQMRRNRVRLKNIPSTRQAIAIPKLITAMYYRKSKIIPDDLIRAAVMTTPIEDQPIAREIAYNIIFKEDEETQNNSTISDSSTENTQSSDLLDIISSELNISELDADQMIDETMEEFSGVMDFVNNFYDKAERNQEPYKSLKDIIEQRSDYRYALEQGIKDLEHLKKHAHKMLSRDMNDLSPSDIISAMNLDWGKDILEQSKTPWVNLASKYLMDSSDFEESLNDILNKKDVGTSARSLDYLNKVGMEKKKVNDLANQLVNRIDNMVDLNEISNVLDYIPSFNQRNVLSNSIKKDISTSFNIARSLDKKFDSNLNNQLFKEWIKKNKSPSLSELFQAQANLPKWQEMLDNYCKKKIDDFINNNGKASYDLADLSKK